MRARFEPWCALPVSCRPQPWLPSLARVAYPYRIVLKALADWLLDAPRYIQAAELLGHRDARIVWQEGFREQLLAVARGEVDQIGVAGSSMVVAGDGGKVLAYVYIAADEVEMRIATRASDDFKLAYKAVLSAESGPTH